MNFANSWTSTSPVNLHWTWSYDSELDELRRLYEKGKSGQWNAQTDLDWEIPFTPDEWVINRDGSMMASICQLMGKDEATQKAAAFDEIGYNLSQLLDGEQAALQLCGQLTNICTEIDQKHYAASQVIDEARHIEVFAKFLSEKVGTIYPIGGGLKTLPNFAELNSPIYMHTVVPNLRNLGLITDRTEDQWRRVGMIYDA